MTDVYGTKVTVTAIPEDSERRFTSNPQFAVTLDGSEIGQLVKNAEGWNPYYPDGDWGTPQSTRRDALNKLVAMFQQEQADRCRVELGLVNCWNQTHGRATLYPEGTDRAGVIYCPICTAQTHVDRI